MITTCYSCGRPTSRSPKSTVRSYPLCSGCGRVPRSCTCAALDRAQVERLMSGARQLAALMDRHNLPFQHDTWICVTSNGEVLVSRSPVELLELAMENKERQERRYREIQGA